MSRIAVAALAALAAPAFVLAVATGGPVTALDASASTGAPSLTAAPASTPSPTTKASPKPTTSPSKPSPTPTSKPTTATQSSSGVPTPAAVTSPVPCPPGQQPYTETSESLSQTPWAQNVLDFNKVWPLTMGSPKITVAVVDSGVSYSDQLNGRLDAIDLTGTGLNDCVGHGTMVAGIIGAADQQSAGNPFAGVAPDVNILSVKVTDSEDVNNQPTISSQAILADGISDAVKLHASVINVSIQAPGPPDSQLQNAMTLALDQNVVVVAAAGNDGVVNGVNEVGPYWPASDSATYPNVLSVGATEQDGSLAFFSDTRTPVDVTAPGDAVTSIVPGGGFYVYNGTSFAAPFVAGVAALIRAEYPSLTAAQVVARIEDTADGGDGPGTGYGLVNPLQAVTAALPSSASPNQFVPPKPAPVAVSRPEPLNPDTRNAAMAVTGGSVSVAALIAVGALVITRGRRRRWQAGAGKAEATATPPDDAIPEDASFW
jgi:membrane-anchored mycosin MYCP